MPYDTGHHEHGEPAESTFLHLLNRLVYLLILLVLLVLTVAFFVPEIRRQRSLTEEIALLRKNVDEERLALSQQNRQLDWLKNDPEYLEILARNRMDLMKEGEMIFRIDPAHFPPPAAGMVPPPAR